MIPLPDDLSPTDVQQWLSDGAVLVRPLRSQELIPAMWIGVPDVGHVQVSLLSSGQPADFPHNRVFCWWPELRAVNTYEGLALYIQRQQTQQYRRTINARAVRVSTPQERAARAWRPSAFGLNTTSFQRCARLLHEAAAYPSVEEAVRAIDDGSAFSRAISPTVALSRGKGEAKLVFYNNDLVAKYIDKDLIPLCAGKLPMAVAKRLGGF